MIEQANFTHSLLEKALEKPRKTIKDQGKKQIKALKNRVEKNVLDTDQKSIASLFSKDFLNEEVTYELRKIAEMENKIDRNDLIYKQVTRKRIKHLIFKSLKQ